MRTTKLDRQLDKRIEVAYYRLAQGVQVSVLDIPRIFRDAKLELSAGVELDTAMVAIIKRYRVN